METKRKKSNNNRVLEIQFYLNQQLRVSDIERITGIPRQLVEYYVREYKLERPAIKIYKA